MTSTVRIPGVPFYFSEIDRELTIPPITLGALQQLEPGIAGFTADMTNTKQIDTVISLTHAALKRNYPEITRDEVGELIDVGNVVDVYRAVMGISGVKRSGEATPPRAT
jgi:hypothetical protein